MRAHRALSWPDRAEHDPESRFILLWIAFSAAYATDIDNRFRLNEQASFKAAKKAANHSLAKQDTPAVLSIVFGRIYTLRNQIIHGDATWNVSVNLEKTRDCVAILFDLVPRVIEVMIGNPGALWGEAGTQ